jgi:hypothetical protein
LNLAFKERMMGLLVRFSVTKTNTPCWEIYLIQNKLTSSQKVLIAGLMSNRLCWTSL